MESSQPYTGSEYKKTDYTVEAANAENTHGLVGETVNTRYSRSRNQCWNPIPGTFENDFKVMKGDVDVTANYNPTKTPGTHY